MLVQGKTYRTIWAEAVNVYIIDQTLLPHRFEVARLSTVDNMCRAISTMQVRGAGLIGAAAGFGMWLAALSLRPGDDVLALLRHAGACLMATRPTAANLAWAVRRMLAAAELTKAKVERGSVQALETVQIVLRAEAQAIADEDAAFCHDIGQHGLAIIQTLAKKKQGQCLNILTHCNAGWLAFVDYGSALAPVYAAQAAGLDIHVWVDETRPRNQGASLTAWELGSQGIAHDIIVDNAGGHLMQHGMVDMVITGADRVSRQGDAANKIGTYLKALAAWDNQVPFYVALPSSTFDFQLCDGVKDIPIEERNAREVTHMVGIAAGGAAQGNLIEVQLSPQGSTARNWAFDVTPARLITALITERGVCQASEQGIKALYPKQGA